MKSDSCSEVALELENPLGKRESLPSCTTLLNSVGQWHTFPSCSGRLIYGVCSAMIVRGGIGRLKRLQQVFRKEEAVCRKLGEIPETLLSGEEREPLEGRK